MGNGRKWPLTSVTEAGDQSYHLSSMKRLRKLAIVSFLLLSFNCFCQDAGWDFFEDGRKYTEEKDYHKSAEYLQKAREASPENPFYAYYLGWLYVYFLDKPAEALVEFEFALSKDYSGPHVWQSYGRALFLLGSFSEAGEAYLKASEMEYQTVSDLRAKEDDDEAIDKKSRGAYYLFESGRMQHLHGDDEQGFELMAKAWRNRIGYLADNLNIAYSSLLYEQGRTDLIEKAWNLVPDDNRWIYIYGLALYREETYAEAAEILENLSPEYEDNGLLILAESHHRSGNTSAAVETAIEALNLPDNDTKVHGDYYLHLVNYLAALEDVDNLANWQDRVLGYYDRFRIDDTLIRFKMSTAYLEAAHGSAQRGDLEKSFALYERASGIYKNGVGEYEVSLQGWKNQLAADFHRAGISDLANENPQVFDVYFEAAEELCGPENQRPRDPSYLCANTKSQKRDFYIDVGRFWNSSETERKEAYRHHFLTLIFMRLKADWIDVDGVPQFHENQFDDTSLVEYHEQFSIFSKIVFYLSRGAILPVNETRLFDGTIVDFESHIWTGVENEEGAIEAITFHLYSIETAQPHPGKILYESRNDIDTFIYMAPTNGMPVVGVALWKRLTFIPGEAYGELRGGIYLGSEPIVQHEGLMHEFFHNVEAAFDPVYKLIRHVFRPGYESYWPEWYSGEEELLYYKLAFNKVILPMGIERLHFRKETDETQPDIWSQTK